MTATTQDTTQPGITQEVSLDEQIAYWTRLRDSHASDERALGISDGAGLRMASSILASLLRLKEIEGKLREPINMRALNNDLMDSMAMQLHYLENADAIHDKMTAFDVTEMAEGGIRRYRVNPIFKAKVDSTVARILDVVSAILLRGKP